NALLSRHHPSTNELFFSILICNPLILMPLFV
ncbi:MAG: hypothetical protein ACI808_003112, partial [Paraglaciecola sp.]